MLGDVIQLSIDNLFSDLSNEFRLVGLSICCVSQSRRERVNFLIHSPLSVVLFSVYYRPNIQK